MKKLVASPQSYPLFRTITRTKRPTLAELESALLVLDTLSGKVRTSSAPALWDVLESLNLPPSQTSWVRALFMDLGRSPPVENSPHRRGEVYLSYLSRLRRTLVTVIREEQKLPRISTPFSALEKLLS